MKSIYVGIFALVMLVATGIVYAEKIADDTNDVWHWSKSNGTFKWASTSGEPNIDITEISYEIQGNKLIFKLKVEGTIENSDKAGYGIYYNTSEANYLVGYAQGTGTCFGISTDGTQVVGGNVTVTGNTLIGTIESIGLGTKIEFWGWAAKYSSTFGNTKEEWWGDWAPNSKAPTESNGEDTGSSEDTEKDGKGTPGFEMALLITAIALIVAFNRRNYYL